MSMAIVGVAGGVVAAGASAYGASQSGAPAPIGPRRIARSTAQGRDLYGGRTYAQDYEDSLRYSALNSLLSGYGLFGNEAGSHEINYRSQIPGGRGRFKNVTRTIQTPAQEGLLSLIRRTQPELESLQQQGDPEGYALLQLLTQDATSMVGGVDPYEDHLTQQNLRQAQSSRGMGFGNSDIFNELLGLELGRRDRRMQAGQYAGGVLGLRRGFKGDPLTDSIRLLGAGQATSGGLAQRSSLYNPQVADSLQNSYAAQLAGYNSSVNNIAALGSGLAQMGQSYNASRPQGYGPGNNYYSNPYAQASMPY